LWLAGSHPPIALADKGRRKIQHRQEHASDGRLASLSW
jgi:hypothetical protein